MKYPAMIKIAQRLDDECVADVPGRVRAELQAVDLASRIPPGARVAITAGSRGISNIATIIKTVVEQVKAVGGKPFIVPAMGSHGGATAEGQTLVLSDLGIAESSMGAPVHASMETVALGETPSGSPVFFDRMAHEADGIIVVNRIKPHTEFQGRIESGLMKMMVIGLGKHKGAISAHNYAVRFGYERTITEIGRHILANTPICLGLGIIENGYGQTARISAVPPETFLDSERGLLAVARQKAAKLPFDRFDILIVDECGKEISGTGMDTKVLGRIRNIYEPELDHPKITRVILRSLTAQTHGNAIGVGLADFVTRRVAEAIDFKVSHINSVTAVTPEKTSLPVVCECDHDALDKALATSGPVAPMDLKMVWIRNTATLGEMAVSQGMLPEVEANGRLRVLGPPVPIDFDHDGNFRPQPQQSLS